MNSLAIPLLTASLGLKTKKRKFLSVEVCTKELKFVFDEIPIDATGRDIFERICRALGLRETQYFGLQFVNNKNTVTWLDLKKKIVDQNIVLDNSAMVQNSLMNQYGLWSTSCPPSPAALSLSPSPLTHHHQIIDPQQQSPCQNTFQPNHYGNVGTMNHQLNNFNTSVISNNPSSEYAISTSHHHPYHSSPSLLHNHLYNGNSLQGNDATTKTLNNFGCTNSFSSDNRPNYSSPNPYPGSIFLQQHQNAPSQSFHPLKRMQHLQASPPGSQNDNSHRGFLQHNTHYHNCSQVLYGNAKSTRRISFDFLVKHFPVNLNEIIQDVTQHLFFLQIKENIIEGKIDCPYNICIRLAAFAAQARFGEFDEKTYRNGVLVASNLLPKRFVQDYQQGPINSAEEEIKRLYIQYKNLSQEEAEMEYLGLAKDLPMYGVSFFPARGKNGRDLWLGVTATGLSIYDRHDQNQPKIKLIFSEIRNLSYNKKKFTIEKWNPGGKDGIVLYSDKTQNNEQAYSLCIGYHESFMMRERPETLEMKQLKAQAMEEKQRRTKERAKLVQEKERREEIERSNRELEYQVHITHERLKEREREAQRHAEEARKALEKAELYGKKAAEAEREVQRIKIGSSKAEQEKTQREVDEAVNKTLGYISDVKDIYSRTMSANNNNTINNNNVTNRTAVDDYYNCSNITNNDSNNNSAYVPVAKVEPRISNYFGKDISQLILDHKQECLNFEGKTQDLQNHIDVISLEVETLKRDNLVSSIYETNIRL